MGAILGTVAGWQRTSEYRSDNRIYESSGYDKLITSNKPISVIYNVIFDVTIYLCDSPIEENIVMISRKTPDINITLESENLYLTGLNGFIKDYTLSEAEELLARAMIEAGGLIACRKPYDIKLISSNIKIIEVFVAGIVYRILRQRARGTYHIYGLSIKEFHDKMREHGYTIKKSDELMRLYKQDKVKTKAKV